MVNELAHRVFDFLKEYPPFQFLPKDKIFWLASRCTIKYLEKDAILFSAGETPPPRFYIVKEGAVHIYQPDGDLVEVCDEGDVLGIRPLIAHSPYLLTAKASEESLLYAVETSDFLPLIEENPKISLFLATNFAVGAGNKYYKKPQDSESSLLESTWTIVAGMDTMHKPVTITTSFSIMEAAQTMVQHNVGSVIICDEKNYPVGIITDKDLRNKVVAGDTRKKENVTLIMTSPVLCTKPGQSFSQLQMMMLKHKISHVVITEDGTNTSRCIGVLSDHDLLIHQSDNPALLLWKITKAESVKDLIFIRDKIEKLIGKWLEQEVSVSFITQIVSALQDEIIRRAIYFAENAIGKEICQRLDYCWLALGSEGREEQLLRTDQDNAILYREDPEFPDQKQVLLTLARDVNKTLMEVGFEYCPANMMASNPEWCLSDTEWQRTFEKWITQPGEKEIMMCTIFFDFRPVYGNKELAHDLSRFVFDILDKQEIFLHFLAQNALQNPPPLSFFRNFIVEKNGEHKDSFDIKLRAMMPLVDAARLMILEKRISGIHHTSERFKALAEHDPANADILQMAADAYEILVRIRTLHGLSSGDSGRYIRPEEMDKMARLMLRNAFQPIDDIQKIIKVRFRV